MVETGKVSYSPQGHLNAIRLFIAGKKAKEKQDKVLLSDLNDADGFDGKAYSLRYAQMSTNFHNMFHPTLKDAMKKVKKRKERYTYPLLRRLERRIAHIPFPPVIRKRLSFIKQLLYR
jgi:hypothetical protein